MTERAYGSDWLEDISSLLPAVTLLQNLGYSYLPPDEALRLRYRKRSRVVLEHVLADWLRTHNSYEAKGQTHTFSEANIQRAVTALSQHPFDALYTTSQALRPADAGQEPGRERGRRPQELRPPVHRLGTP